MRYLNKDQVLEQIKIHTESGANRKVEVLNAELRKLEPKPKEEESKDTKIQDEDSSKTELQELQELREIVKLMKESPENPIKKGDDNTPSDCALYEMAVEGMSWKHIANFTDVKQPWHGAKRHAKANDLKFPLYEEQGTQDS